MNRLKALAVSLYIYVGHNWRAWFPDWYLPLLPANNFDPLVWGIGIALGYLIGEGIECKLA